MELLKLQGEWVGDIYQEKFELVELTHDFGWWTKVIKGIYYFEDGTTKTESEVNKRMWELHRQKCDFHKDFTKKPKD